MKFLKLFFLASLLGGAQAHAETYMSADPNPPSFCLQNFNAYGPIYAARVEERTERMTGFLQGVPKCDVVHLQEVWNEPQILQIENSLQRQYAISAPNKETRIGLMSLLMGEIKGRQTLQFYMNNEGGVLDTVRDLLNVKKAFHVVRAGLAGIDEDFIFMNTHLHPTSTAVRLTQMIDLLRWRLHSQSLKLVLSGDFNAGVDSVERKFLMLTLGVRDSMEEYFGGNYPANYCTYCAGNPLGWMLSDRTFDYVFYSNIGTSETTLKTISGEVNMRGTPRKPWSDHYGVRVKFSVIPEVSETDLFEIEKRRGETLKVLEEAQTILLKEKNVDFKRYALYVQLLMKELQERQGLFNSYFEKYR